MHELKLAIRKALAGSSSSAPVDTKSLLSLGKADEVMAALELLLASREINTAAITRGAVTTVQCWLTGAVGLAPAFHPRMPAFGHESARLPPQVPQAAAKPPAAKVKPTASIPTQQPKEQTMNNPRKSSGSRASPIVLAIIELVGEQPGISKEKLLALAVKREPGSTADQAIKAVGNLTHMSKKIRAEGKRGHLAYFLNDGTKAKPVADSTLPEAKIKPIKAKKTKAAKLPKSSTCTKKQVGAVAPVGAGHAREPIINAAADDIEFRIALQENCDLLVVVGNIHLALSRDHYMRLHRFIGRINPDGGAT